MLKHLNFVYNLHAMSTYGPFPFIYFFTATNFITFPFFPIHPFHMIGCYQPQPDTKWTKIQSKKSRKFTCERTNSTGYLTVH